MYDMSPVSSSLFTMYSVSKPDLQKGHKNFKTSQDHIFWSLNLKPFIFDIFGSIYWHYYSVIMFRSVYGCIYPEVTLTESAKLKPDEFPDDNIDNLMFRNFMCQAQMLSPQNYEANF